MRPFPTAESILGAAPRGTLREGPARDGDDHDMSRRETDFDDSRRDHPSSQIEHRELPRGTRLGGKYEIQALIAVGGMGAIYEAVQLEVGRTVAIKVLHQYEQDPAMRARFLREVIVLSRVQHVHVVTLFDAGVREDGLRYFAMEHLDGRSLSAVLRQSGPLDPRRAVRIASQICQALTAAHSAGVVHRDLKPSNVLLVPMGREPEFVKVIDFGIARFLLVDPEAPGITAARQVVGTPRYMAPEQIRGDAIDPRTDIYALGCLLFELLTHRPPFIDPSELALIDRHLHHAPPRFREVNPRLSIDPDLEEIVRTMLGKRAEERFPSCEAVESALSLWCARAATETDTRSVQRAKESPPAVEAEPAKQGQGLPSTREMRGSGSGSNRASEPAAQPPTRDDRGASVTNEEDETPVLPHGLDPVTDDPIVHDVHQSAVEAIEVLDAALREQESRKDEATSRAPSRSQKRMPRMVALPVLVALGFAAAAALTLAFNSHRDQGSIVVRPESLKVPVENMHAEQSPGLATPRVESREQTVDLHPVPSASVAELAAAPGVEKKQPARPEAPIRVRNIQVEHGSVDAAEVASILQARAKDIARCFVRTQRSETSSRTLRLHFMSSEGSTSIRALPNDAASQRFSECVATLDPQIPLPVSPTRAVYLFSADVGSGVVP
jgi:serine/threonine protein kinase